MRRLSLIASAALIAACARGPSSSDLASASAAGSDLAGALARSGVQCQPNQPPQVLACDHKGAGDPCEVVDDEGTAQGTCKAIPDGRLVCASDDERDGGEDGGDQQDGDQNDGDHHDGEHDGGDGHHQDGEHDGGDGHHHDGERPPPLALVQACLNLAADAACTAKLDERTISGTCRTLQGVLVCLPLPPPPPAPIAACAQKAAGAACSLTLHDKTVDGTCRAFGEHAALACVPAAGPASAPPAAVDACVDHAADATCSFNWEDHTFKGACQKAPDGTLVCAPICR